MAKVKTTELDDQLSVVLQQTAESVKTVKEANAAIAAFKQEVAQVSKDLIKTGEEQSAAFSKVIKAEIALFEENIQKVTESVNTSRFSIEQTTELALEKIETVARHRMVYTKAGFWCASIATMMMVGFVGWIEIQRRIDLSTINDAKAMAVKSYQQNTLWKQWLSENPKNEQAFLDWVQKTEKK